MAKRRKKGVRKGQEAPGRYDPPERHAGGTFGSHRSAGMEEGRAARLARIRSARSGKFTDNGFEEER